MVDKIEVGGPGGLKIGEEFDQTNPGTGAAAVNQVIIDIFEVFRLADIDLDRLTIDIEIVINRKFYLQIAIGDDLGPILRGIDGYLRQLVTDNPDNHRIGGTDISIDIVGLSSQNHRATGVTVRRNIRRLPYGKYLRLFLAGIGVDLSGPLGYETGDNRTPDRFPIGKKFNFPDNLPINPRRNSKQ